MRLAVAACLLLGLAAAGRTARADDIQVQARFDQGVKLFDEGEYDRAVEAFEGAYKERPLPDLLMNIATCYERLYRADKARDAYERFLATNPPAGSDLRLLAEKRLRVLRVLPGSITVDVAHDGASVLLTGSGLERRARSPVTFGDIPPGAYHVHVEEPGWESIDQDVKVLPGSAPIITQRLAREQAELSIDTTPEGAHIFLDGLDTGEVTNKATTFRRWLDVGEHSVRLELPDRKPLDQKIQVEAGKPVRLDVKLPAPPRSGRTEMLIAGMVFGGYAAPALTVAIGGTRITTGNNLAIVIPVALAGVGLGLLGSWVLTDDNMKVGHSSIISGGTVWGAVAGASLAFGLGLTGDEQRFTQQNTLALSLLGGGLGLGAGILTAWLNDTSAGDAALVNSGALWGTLTTTLLTEAISFRRADHDRAFGWLTLGGNALGLTTGALLAWGLETSRAQVAVVDAAGALGSVIGYGIGYAAGKNEDDPNSGSVCLNPNNRCISGARYALGGMALGLLSAALLSRRFHFEVPRTEALLQHHRGRWQLGLPAVHLGAGLVATEGGLRFASQAVVDVARGEW